MALFDKESSFLKNAGNSWNYSEPAAGTRRFELRSGDYYDNPLTPPAEDDQALGKNRSEIVSLQRMQPGRLFTVDFEFMVEGGARNTSDWLVLAQIHQSEDTIPGRTDGVASPPLAISLRGERLEIEGRTDPNPVTTTTPPNIVVPPYNTPQTNTMYLDSQALPRDTWTRITIEVVFDSNPRGAGMLRVLRDGVVIVDYKGPIGYNDMVGPYLQLGLYRDAVAETIAAQYRNITIDADGAPPPMNGTAGNDHIEANSLGFWEGETLNGLAGDDTLDGGVGDDTMNGGSGNDFYIVNERGDVVNERLRGIDEGGNDTVASYVSYVLGEDIENLQLWGRSWINATGNARTNEIRGNTGNNLISGLGGHDSLFGDAGADTLYGGAGNDTAYGALGNDTLYGDEGDDTLFGEDGDDTLYGGAGNDLMEGGPGISRMEGGAGNDAYVIDNLRDIVVELANGGIDTVRAAVSFDAGAAGHIEIINTTNQSGRTTLTLRGTDLANQIRGNEGTNTLSGRGGDDLIQGFGGADSLDGGTGNDSLYGGDGNDSLQGGLGDDLMLGGAGDDTIDGGGGNDSYFGGAGNDTIRGGSVSSSLSGEEGDDTLFGGADRDTLDGGTGADRMTGGDSNDSYVVDNLRDVVIEGATGGIDTVRYLSSWDAGATNHVEIINPVNQARADTMSIWGTDGANEIRGNAGVNSLYGRAGDDLMFGNAGDDLIDGGAGLDTVYGDDGADTLRGGDDRDILRGGTGNDRLSGDAGDDSLYGEADDDIMTGGAGNDLFFAGYGNDRLELDGGNDTAYGGAGNDTVVLRALSTEALAVAGSTMLRLTIGTDVLSISNDVEFIAFADRTLRWADAGGLDGGGTGRLVGGTAAGEPLYGGSGNDTLNALAGNDTLFAGAGDDTLYGGDGDDTLYGGDGRDSFYGGAGNDTYHVTATPAIISEAAGGGIDTVRTTVSITLPSWAEVEILRVSDQASTGALNLTGSDIGNEIRGNNGANRIDGGLGADTMFGYLGNDIYVVDNLGDRVNETAGSGFDTIETFISLALSSVQEIEVMRSRGTGLSLSGNAGANTIFGDAGANWINGREGDDRILAGAGNDTIYGGTGNDTLVVDFASTEAAATAGTSSMRLVGPGAENDFIANDVEIIQFTDRSMTWAEAALLRSGPVTRAPIQGTGVGDNLPGTPQDDTILGWAGNDWITPGTGNDSVDGGAGTDMLSLVDLPAAANVNLGTGIITSGGDTKQVTGIENLTGTIFSDFITGNAGANLLRGLGDFDWFVGSGGGDTFDGGTGRDMVSYIAATAGVTVDLAAGRGFTGQAAGDTYTAVERITGTSFADTLYGAAGEEDLRGMAGDDMLFGSPGGRERFDGGAGIDTVNYGRATAGVEASLALGRGSAGDAARDLYTAIENLTGTGFSDRLTGDAGRNMLTGQSGDDFLFGLDGNDRLIGGFGDDSIDGGGGYDIAVFCRNRADYVITQVGNTTIVDQIGAGGDGIDRLTNVEVLAFADQTLTL